MPSYKMILLLLAFALFLLLCGRVRIAPPDLAFYYAVPQSIVNDLDITFHNEYQHFTFAMHELYRTPRGYPANDWPVGTGLCWLPFFILAKLLCGITGIPYEEGGSWFAKWVVTYGATVFYGFGAIWLTWKWCLLEGLPKQAVRWALLLHVIGSTFTYHLYVNSADSHAPSAFFTALLLYTWRRMKENPAHQTYLLLGLICGFAAMVRPHNVMFILIPLLCDGWKALQQKSIKRYVLSLLLLIGAFFAAFFPQLVVWKALYGSWLAMPRSGDMLWLEPKWFDMLFSHYHGMLSWSPLFAFAVIGLFLSRKGLVFSIPVLIQLYLFSSHIAWWAGGSFGNRRVISCIPLFVFGLALLFHQLPKKWLKATAVLCALWTLALMMAEIGGALPLSQPLYWTQIFQAIPEGIGPGILFHVSLPQWEGHVYARLLGWLAVTVVLMLMGYLISRIKWNGMNVSVAACAGVILMGVMSGWTAWRSEPLPEAARQEYIPYDRFNWEVYYESGFYHLSQADFDLATRKYLASVALEPRHPQPWRYLSIIWKTKNCDVMAYQYAYAAMISGYRSPEFLEYFEELITEIMIDDRFPRHLLYNQRGIVRTVLNEYVLAGDDFKRSLEIKPDYERARNNLDDLEEWKRGNIVPMDWE